MSVPLSDTSPPIADELVKALVSINIHTTADLVFNTPVTILRQLPRGTTTLGELSTLIARVTASMAAPAFTGEEMSGSESQEENEVVRTGVRDLDDLMGGFGGAGNGRVIEVSGDSGSGKTALALHLVLHHLATQENAAALWMDSTGDLSPTRLMRAIPSHSTGSASSSILERLHISQAFDMDAAYEVLENLRSALAATPDISPRPRILVIDTITPILGPQLSAVSSRGHAAMTSFMRLLGTVARTFGLAVLTLNTSTTLKPFNPASMFSTTARKPALGPSFTFLTDATLWLAHPPPSSIAAPSASSSGTSEASVREVRVAELLRSRISKSRSWCLFRIRDGIVLSM